MGGSNIIEVIQSLQSMVTSLQATVGRLEAQYDKSKPMSDPDSTTGSERQDLGNTCRVQYGRVAEVLPFYGWYKVFPDGGNTPIACNLGAAVSITPIGVRPVGALQPSSRVYFVRAVNSKYGTIIAVEPAPVIDASKSISDYISQAGRNTPASEQVIHAIFQQPGHGVISYANGRPLDETTVGEWGYMSELGVGVFVDSFMSFLRADENCGFWAFYHDQKARVQGHNLEVRSAGYEDIHQDDIAEFNRITGSTPYPFEALGAIDPSAKVYKERTSEQSQMSEAEFAVIDLADQKQTPFFRSVSYEGYLGQGGRRSVVLPPSGASLMLMGDDTPRLGVFDEQVSLDGHYLLRSATSITFAHVPPFALPIRVKLADDKEGDTEENYHAGGRVGGGSEHVIASDIEVSGEHQRMTRTLAIDDGLAYSTQWRGDHPFFYHKKDFKLHEPAELSDGGSGTESPPGYGTLASEWYLPDSEPITEKVDHRFDAKLHRLLSLITFLPDGGLVLAAGGGEELRLAGGSAELSAPGDVNLRPGRNALIKAGRDVIIHGYDSVDVTATIQDVRIKAERNVEILAANSESGVLLLESKSKGIQEDFANKVGTEVQGNGVVIKSAGLATVLGDLVYLRSGAISGIGTITLDAARGKSPVVITAQLVEEFVEFGHYMWFGSEGSYPNASIFTPVVTLLGGALEVNGITAIHDELITGGWIIVADGHIATSDAETFSYFVPPLKDEGLDKAKAAIEKIAQDEADAAAKGGPAWTTAVDELYYQDKRVGNKVVIEQIGFSFRTTTQARCDKFLMFESRWQQRQRLTGGGQMWTEKPVKAGSATTHPWPGTDAWVGGTTYNTVDLNLYKVQSGTPEARGPAYEGLKPVVAKPTTPDGNYPIIG